MRRTCMLLVCCCCTFVFDLDFLCMPVLTVAMLLSCYGCVLSEESAFVLSLSPCNASAVALMSFPGCFSRVSNGFGKQVQCTLVLVSEEDPHTHANNLQWVHMLVMLTRVDYQLLCLVTNA